MKHTFGYIILSLLLASTASAQLQCSSVFTSEAAAQAAHIDSAYLENVKSWETAWNKNLRNKLLGNKAPVLTDAQGLNISEFHKARSFRSWFESSNRTASLMNEKAGEVNAQVKLMDDPRKALAAKIMAIREAKYTVDIAYYIVRGDETGMAIMGELKEAIRRGVNVRFVVDSLGTVGMSPHSPLRALIDFAATDAGYLRDLNGNLTSEKAKIEIVAFNPLSSAPVAIFRNMVRSVQNFALGLLNMPTLDPLANSINRRSHDKILLIDGAFEDKAIAFIGGRNISNDYYGVPKVDENTYVDTEVMMKGLPSAQIDGKVGVGTQVQQYFDQIYFHLGNKVMSRSLLGMVKGYDRQLEKMDSQSQVLAENLKLNEDSEAVRQDLLEDGFADHQVEIVNTFHNIYRTHASRKIDLRDHKLAIKNSKALVSALEQQLAQEKEEITLVSPYLWMTKRQVRMIKKWLLADPNRKFTVVTNSIMTSDNLLAQIMVDSVMGPEFMLDKGITRADGTVARRSIADQVKIYEFGKLDSTDLGGAAPYGKLHMKAVFLKSSQTSIIGTYNNDPRSLLLNSEGAAIVKGPAIAQKFEGSVNDLVSRSHLWGSEEYHAIRAHEKLPGIKRYVAAKMQTFYDLILRLNLWWLI